MLASRKAMVGGREDLQPLGSPPGLGRFCLLLVTQAQASLSEAQAMPIPFQVPCRPIPPFPLDQAQKHKFPRSGLGRNCFPFFFFNFISERRADIGA